MLPTNCGPSPPISCLPPLAVLLPPLPVPGPEPPELGPEAEPAVPGPGPLPPLPTGPEPPLPVTVPLPALELSPAPPVNVPPVPLVKPPIPGAPALPSSFSAPPAQPAAATRSEPQTTQFFSMLYRTLTHNDASQLCPALREASIFIQDSRKVMLLSLSWVIPQRRASHDRLVMRCW